MSVLFLTACSRAKKLGGTVDFDHSATIAAALPAHAERLAARREAVRTHVMGGEAADWQGVALRRLQYNHGLVQGRDFGGQSGTHYLPAMDRYQGRIFRDIRDDDRVRRRAKLNTLIVSGLYGLLRALEPIQLYSCPLSADVASIWRRDQLLTDILCGYIERSNVLRVFDLTAMGAYRYLIDWDRVARDGTDVLHCFDTTAAGDSALTSFGPFFQYLLSLDDDDLIALEPCQPGPEFGTCRLHRAVEPPSDYPRETWQAAEATEVVGGGNPDVRLWPYTVCARFIQDTRDVTEEANRAVQEICRAPMTPRGDTIQPLEGHNGQLWRYRTGERRLVYRPDVGRRVVHLLRFGPRRDVYRNLTP